jgi:hypothetical protein
MLFRCRCDLLPYGFSPARCDTRASLLLHVTIVYSRLTSFR